MEKPIETLEEEEIHSSEDEGEETAKDTSGEQQQEEQDKECDDYGYDDNYHHGEVDLTKSNTPTLDALTGTGVCAPTHEDSSRPRSPRMLERFEASDGYLPRETEEGYEHEEAAEELGDDNRKQMMISEDDSKERQDAYPSLSKDGLSDSEEEY
ncbi:hypothetical protein VTN00DRAFT_6790 [Thermoascus crustaceus]|uniref:uncharacterized protein n=1 Tax=Thermoascus crustaceus TaxID=5088 RepID=UPI0037423569